MKSEQQRLVDEKKFHDDIFSSKARKKVDKFYLINEAIEEDYEKIVMSSPTGKTILEYGCGMGSKLIELDRKGATTFGIDISDYAIQQLSKQAGDAGAKTQYKVMNAEALEFPDRHFDLIYGSGILHHLDLNKSLATLSAKLKPGGTAVFIEPLGHNPIINGFRNRTPDIRTEDEHPLLMSDIRDAGSFFGKISLTYYYLSTLALPVVLGHNVPRVLIKLANLADKAIFAMLPFMRKYAWQVLLKFENPKNLSVNIPFVDLKAQYLSIKPQIDRAISQTIEESSFIGGKSVVSFEKKFAALLGVKHCIGVGNGTDAIYIALRMMGIKPGDEVITTATSWISTSETITQAGAIPVFVDIDPITYTIDSKKIEEKITSKTKAIIPVHLYGQAAHIGDILAICKKHNLKLIEDCAQSHFTTENGVIAGTIGDVATFSFYPGKNLGAYGDAGALVTNDDALARNMRMYANHGALKKHEHEIEGINSRLDGLQAAILNCKADHILAWTEARIRHASRYSQNLKAVGQVETPAVRVGTKHTFHLYVIRCDRRDELKAFLEKNGVSTAIHYPSSLPNLKAYAYLGHTRSSFPIASVHQDRILSLPLYPELEDNQIDYVCGLIKTFLTRRRDESRVFL